MGMNESRQPIQIRFQAAVFTADELSRLAAYRAAIAAGFYTDTCDETTDTPTNWTGLAHHISDTRGVGR